MPIAISFKPRHYCDSYSSLEAVESYQFSSFVLVLSLPKICLNLSSSKYALGVCDVMATAHRSTALYIYKAKNCKLLVLFTHEQKTKFIFK